MVSYNPEVPAVSSHAMETGQRLLRLQREEGSIEEPGAIFHTDIAVVRAKRYAQAGRVGPVETPGPGVFKFASQTQDVLKSEERPEEPRCEGHGIKALIGSGLAAGRMKPALRPHPARTRSANC